MNELALFAGSGGGILAGKLLGWNTVCAVEIEKYPREVLLQRQRDGILGKFPIWDDICTFDGRAWANKIDIISGGFPCQDISAAGNGAGIEGSRSGLWGEMARVICEVRPRFAFVENSPMLTSRGLHRVLGDLAEMGYDARWCVLGADDIGADHHRKRIWILAYSKHCGFHRSKTVESFEKTICRTKKRQEISSKFKGSYSQGMLPTNKTIRLQRLGSDQSGLDRVADVVAGTVDRIKAIGNGQVPAVAAIAFIILSEGLV